MPRWVYMSPDWHHCTAGSLTDAASARANIIWKIMELGLSCHLQPRVHLLGAFFRWLRDVISQFLPCTLQLLHCSWVGNTTGLPSAHACHNPEDQRSWLFVGSIMGFPGDVRDKEPSANARDIRESRDADLISGSGRFPGGGHGNPLHSMYSCLKNLMDRGALWSSVHRVANRMQLSMHTHTRRGSNSKGTPQILDIRHRFIPLFLEIFCETSTSCCEDGASLVKCFLYLLSFWSFTPLSLNFPPSGLYSQGICYLRICLKYTWASTPSGFRFGTMGCMEWCRLFRRKWV